MKQNLQLSASKGKRIIIVPTCYHRNKGEVENMKGLTTSPSLSPGVPPGLPEQSKVPEATLHLGPTGEGPRVFVC